jgi:hypothetical protein
VAALSAAEDDVAGSLWREPVRGAGHGAKLEERLAAGGCGLREERLVSSFANEREDGFGHFLLWRRSSRASF